MPRAARSADAVRHAPASTTLVAAGAAVALGAAFLVSPDHVESGPVICPLRRLTGLPCPGCGLTRSWVYLAHGWWREAFSAHLFGAVAALAAIALVTAVVVALVRRRPPPDLDALVRRPWVAGLAVAWLVYAGTRLTLAA